MNLKTNRLLIRPFDEKDADALHGYVSNPSVMTYLPEDVFDLETTHGFIAEQSRKPEKYAVTCGEKLVGHIVFHPYFGDHTYEIGWVFHPDHQGKGYASEAASAVLEHGFGALALHRIIATCQPENIASWRVMEKIGMRREGHFKKCIPAGDDWWDEYYYSILQEEWKRPQAQA